MEEQRHGEDAAFVRRVLRSPLLDGVLAVALAAYAAADALTGGEWPEPHPVSAVLAALAGGFLAARRTRPLISLTGALGALAAVSVALGHYESGSSVLIALSAAYAAGAYGGNVPYALAVLTAFALTEGIGQPAAEATPDVLWTCAALALPFGVGRSVRQLTSRARAAERHAHLLRREQRELAQAAAEAERRRIARELHDVISHGLAVVMLQAGAAEHVLDSDPGKAREALRQIRATGQEAINGMSTLVGMAQDGQPARHPPPTLADLEHLVVTTRTAGLAVSVHTEGEPRKLDASVELNAYRVAQEGLTNALKHAGGAEVRIVLRYQPDAVEVEVHDDGATDTGRGPGSRQGIVGLRERAAVFGGHLQAGPDPRGGWTLRAAFPTTP
ncbi:sensor histidine kinase [Streptomyces sp. NPDC001107]